MQWVSARGGPEQEQRVDVSHGLAQIHRQVLFRTPAQAVENLGCHRRPIMPMAMIAPRRYLLGRMRSAPVNVTSPPVSFGFSPTPSNRSPKSAIYISGDDVRFGVTVALWGDQRWYSCAPEVVEMRVLAGQ